MNKSSGGTVTSTKTYYPAGGAMRVDGTRYYVLKDQLGSASVVTNQSATTVGEDRFYPFGETRFTTGNMKTDKLFTGQREMAGLGIYHYGARFYSPKLGRFLSADSIVPGYANPQSLNRYSYVLNNPLRYTDPSGHKCEPQPECDGPSPERLDQKSLTDSGKVGYKIYRKFFKHMNGSWILDPRIDPRFMTNDGNFTVKNFVAMVLFEESNSISRAPYFGTWTETNVRGFYDWKKGQDPQFTSGSEGLLNYMWGTSGRNTRTEVSFDGGPGASTGIPAMQGVANAMLDPASANHPEWADGCVPGRPCYMGSYTSRDKDPNHNLPYIFDFMKHGCLPRWGPLVGGPCNPDNGAFLFFLDRCQSAYWRGKDDPTCP